MIHLSKEGRRCGAGTLRGNKDVQPFKLIILQERSWFQISPLLNGSEPQAQRSIVNEADRGEIARSDELPPGRTEWKVPKPLTRGKIYLAPLSPHSAEKKSFPLVHLLPK